MADQTFYIGVNGFLVRDGLLLLGKRKNCFGEGDWGLPGGHLESGENLGEAVSRELMEETGLVIHSWKFSNLVNYPQQEKHYLQIGFVAEDFSGEPELKEPDRCFEWKWFDLNDLPLNLFVPHQKQIQAFLNGEIHFTDSH